MYALDARRQERLSRGHVLPWAHKYIEEPIVPPEPDESSEDSPLTDSSEESNEDDGQDMYVPKMNHVIDLDSDSDMEL